MPYYSEVDKWSNLYTYHIGIGRSYGHGFKTVNLSEIIFHNGYIIRDGIRGVTVGAIYCHWWMYDDYDNDIANGVKYWHCIQIKEFKNMQQRHSQKKVQDGYNPS